MVPSVSVIIPSYNHAPFLKQRIESVLHQTWQDFEVIILDDCSLDDSREIIELYRNHKKVKNVVYNEKNSGSTFKQWQKGIELAKGQYIWIAESDDFADVTLLATLMQPFISEPDLILSYCQSVITDEFDTKHGVSEWADVLDKFRWKQDYIEQTSIELNNYLGFRNTIVNASAVLFRKPSDISILEESTKMKILGDWLFWRKLLDQKGKMAFSSAPLNFFRLHPQTTRAAATKEKELIRMKEQNRLIIPHLLNVSDKRYDWMIWEWYSNRRMLKGTLYYYFPSLPVTLIIRYILLFSPRIIKKVFPFTRYFFKQVSKV